MGRLQYKRGECRVYRRRIPRVYVSYRSFSVRLRASSMPPAPIIKHDDRDLLCRHPPQISQGAGERLYIETRFPAQSVPYPRKACPVVPAGRLFALICSRSAGPPPEGQYTRESHRATSGLTLPKERDADAFDIMSPHVQASPYGSGLVTAARSQKTRRQQKCTKKKKRAASILNHVSGSLTYMTPLLDLDTALYQVDKHNHQNGNDYQADDKAHRVAAGLKRIGMCRQLMDLLVREHT